MGLVDKLFFLSNPCFHKENFELIFNILTKNDYPINFIFNIFKSRLKKNFYKNNNFKQHISDKVSNNTTKK